RSRMEPPQRTSRQAESQPIGYGSCCRRRCLRRSITASRRGSVRRPPGALWRGPLGRATLPAIVGAGVGANLPAERLKPIFEILPTPPLQPELRHFVERVAGYTMAPLGSVLRMAMSVPEALQPPRPRR